MPRQSSNRIEVDLKLLQDRNLERLSEFGKGFDKSIDKLATLVGDFNQQIEGARGIADQQGKASPSASEASNVRIDSVPARMGGSSTGGGGFSGGFVNPPGGYGGGGTPSIAPPLPDPETAPGDDLFEKQYIEAQKRIGEIPIGPRQALGYAASGQISIPGISQNTAKKLNNWLFTTQAVKANAMLAGGKVQSFFGEQINRAALGQSLGRSREGGLFGTPIFSSAWKTGFMETMKTGMASDFGFSPNYTMAQAQQARQALQGYGYSGDTSDRLASMLKELQIHQGIDATSAMTMIDPLMRFGGPQSMGDLTNALRNIPNAAAAARMNLQEFTQQLVQTAAQVSQATGMTPGQAAAGLSAYSAVTGMAPSAAAATISDPSSMYQASGLTGKSLWDVTYGTHATSDRLRFGALMWNNATGGMSAQEMMHQIKTGNSSVMNGVMALWNSNHDIFGGMSPLQYLHSMLANNGHAIAHERINESMQMTSHLSGMDKLLKAWGGPAGANMSHQFEAWEAKNAGRHWKNPKSEMDTARRFASSLLKSQERNSNTRASRQVTIGLSHEAKKFFDIVGGNDTPQRNSIGHYGRKSVGVLAHVMEDVQSPMAALSDLVSLF